VLTGWSKEDYIRWCEWRLRDSGEEYQAEGYGFSHQDLRVWLLRERDEKSLSDIAQIEFARFWKKKCGKRENQRVISLVRRSFNRVNKFLNQGGEGFIYADKRKSALRQEALAVYMLTGRAPIIIPGEVKNRKAIRRRTKQRKPKGS
jgi:hypothetical protein